MIHTKKMLSILAVALIMVSCTGKWMEGDVPFETAEYHDIDLRTCVDENPVYACTTRLSDEFCDIELIPLENREDELLGEILKIQACDSDLYILDMQETLHHYKLDGSFVSRIGAKGHSKAEYTEIWNFSANATGDTVAILDYGYVKFYGGDGKFLMAEPLRDTPQWQGFLCTDKGFFLSTSNRGLNTTLAMYTNDFRKGRTIIKGQVNLIRDMPSSWQNLLCRDGHRICYFDYYTSTFYIFDQNNVQDCKIYALHSPDALTEDKVRNTDKRSSDFDHLKSYVFEDSTIWGCFKYGKQLYDFKLDTRTDSCLMNHHIDMGYTFLCSHDGWYYYFYEPSQLLMLLGPEEKERYYAMNELLGDALMPFADKMRETDNYFILRMRKKSN